MDPIKENTDLNQQYQEILDRYAKELKTPDPEVIKSETNPQDNISLPPMPTALPTTTTTPVVVPASNPIFKYFFYLSLLIFLGVVGSIVYSMTQNSSNSNSALRPTPIPLPTVVAEDAKAKYCETNDKKVIVGDSFSAADGCNICTCNDDQTIKCTENVCATTITPTTGTSPAEVKPTSKPTVNKALMSADSESPASGVCSEIQNGALVTVIIGEDGVAQPKCIKVNANQKLIMVNNSSTTITINKTKPSTSIKSGSSQQFNTTFGNFLAPGVHQFGGVEIWLQ